MTPMYVSTRPKNTYRRKIGNTTATGGIMRCETIQFARCLPPVEKRARLYAQMNPRNIASTVLKNATTRLLPTVAASPSLNRTAYVSKLNWPGYHLGGNE